MAIIRKKDYLDKQALCTFSAATETVANKTLSVVKTGDTVANVTQMTPIRFIVTSTNLTDQNTGSVTGDEGFAGMSVEPGHMWQPLSNCSIPQGYTHLQQILNCTYGRTDVYANVSTAKISDLPWSQRAHILPDTTGITADGTYNRGSLNCGYAGMGYTPPWQQPTTTSSVAPSKMPNANSSAASLSLPNGTTALLLLGAHLLVNKFVR